MRPVTPAGRAAAAVFVLMLAAGCGQASPPGAPAAPTGSQPTAPRTAAAPATAPRTTAAPTGGPAAPRARGWTRLAPAPLGFATAAVWTGSRMLVLGERLDGGAVTRYDLAAYDPARNRWQRQASPPEVVGRYEGVVRAVWTGREMLAWGGVLAGAYNPATNTWRRLPQGPITSSGYGPGGHAMVWTGRQLIVWGGGCCGGVGAGGAAYTPASDRWTALPPAPLAGRMPNAAWTGRELVIAGGQGEHGPLSSAAAYDPASRTWRRLPPVPVAVGIDGAVWDGTEVLLSGAGWALNPRTGHWRRLPAATGRHGAVQVWTGRRLLVWGGALMRPDGEQATPPHGLAYDPVANRWTALPVSPLAGRTGAVAVWTGRELVIWGGWYTRGYEHATDGAAYTPAYAP